MADPIQVRRLGTVEYDDGLRMQAQLVLARQQDLIPDQLLLVEHPHVFTLGRRGDTGNVLLDAASLARMGVEVHESVRGGDVTYHGPGQVVMYPILALPPSRQDIIQYVRDLEEVMIRTLAEYGIQAGRITGLSGAWVGQDKIGAIGVRISRWVTSHGIGLNVNTNLRYFQMIVPCGIRGHGVTSLQRLLDTPLVESEVQEKLIRHMASCFGLAPEPRSWAFQSVQAVVFRRSPEIQVLVMRRVDALGGFWQPVTGRIEAGESPLQAAVREVQEETGFASTALDLRYVHGFLLDPEVFRAPGWEVPSFVQEHGFACEVQPGADPTLDPSTHDAYCWLSPDDALQKVPWPGNKVAIRRLLKALDAPLERPRPTALPGASRRVGGRD